jgi:hypothetical protein
MLEPPQESAYQVQAAAKPSDPPLTRTITLLPEHKESTAEVTAVGAVDKVCMNMVLLTQAVVLQVPSALAKYVVVVVGFTTMLLPVPMAVPPQELLYHFQLAFPPSVPPLMRSVLLPPLHTESTDAVIDVAAEDNTFTLMVLLSQRVALQKPSARTK